MMDIKIGVSITFAKFGLGPFNCILTGSLVFPLNFSDSGSLILGGLGTHAVPQSTHPTTPPEERTRIEKLFSFSLFSLSKHDARYESSIRAQSAHGTSRHRRPLRRFFPLRARDRTEVAPRSTGDRDHGVYTIFSLCWMKEHP